MKKLVGALALIILLADILPAQAPVFENLRCEALLRALQQTYSPDKVAGYGPAREFMYRDLDNVNDSIYCFYTGFRRYLDPQAERASTYLYNNNSRDGINCEHLWPRSKGAEKDPAKSDLHALVPTRIDVNDIRSNFPFGEIDDLETKRWYRMHYMQKNIPPPSSIDEYSEWVQGLFEPRETVKGDVARAMFYFYTIYREACDAADPNFFELQRETFCNWHRQDPADDAERIRTRRIASVQGNVNPFVLDPSLPERTYCDCNLE